MSILTLAIQMRPLGVADGRARVQTDFRCSCDGGVTHMVGYTNTTGEDDSSDELVRIVLTDDRPARLYGIRSRRSSHEEASRR